MATAAQLEMVGQPRTRNRFSPEFELLVACCQQHLDSDRLTQALQSPIDWDITLRLSDRYRMLPALHRAVYERQDVPAGIKSALWSRFQSNVLKALRFSAELARITRAFADSGIEVLAHKGPALGQLLYGDPAMRQFGDLDFLIRPGDMVRARAVLRQLGYAPQLQLSPRQERAYLQSGYEYVFAVGGQRNLLELQWRILPRFYAIEFDLEAMFQRSAEVTVEGFRAHSLGREDLMLVLCVHAAKHGWAQLGMLRDIAALIHSGLDWNWIHVEARRIGILRILSISLVLTRSLMGCRLPEGLVSAEEIWAAEKLAQAVQFRLIAGEEPDTQSLHYFRKFAGLRERWQDRTRMMSRLALTPCVGEWGSGRLPDWLFPLYRTVRIARLLKRALASTIV
jgi:hypothetical protein